MTPKYNHKSINELLEVSNITSKIHGLKHWENVAILGGNLARMYNLPCRLRLCVEVFGWTHDLWRLDDGGGNQHAIDGANRIARSNLLITKDLDKEQLALISIAIRYHADGLTVQKATKLGVLPTEISDSTSYWSTIACCWDADRLDLIRLGRSPKKRLMSSSYWATMVELAADLNGIRY